MNKPCLPPRGHALRKGRVSLPNHSYLLTTVTEQREPVFIDFAAARLLIACLKAVHNGGFAESLAFVVMPDHLHWLVQLGETMPLRRVVQTIKGRSSRLIGLQRQSGASKPLWQPGYHDHALRSDEDVRQVARYIVGNPIRAGLVEHIGDYPFWDAFWL